ncbi:MAG: DUF4261 domain-containing protein [Lachnospiraceae bacterium]|nr:DUF4261 domain-containing protein [Lachnospiraceae bacterium]
MNFEGKKEEAVNIMIGWLSHENELGKAPAKIEVAGEFDYDDNHYFILKFKEGIFSKWEVAVCGFDENGEECGHTFSEFEPYAPKTAQEKCISMIEYLKEYWKGRFYAELERRGVTEEEYENMTEEEWQAKGQEADEREQQAGGKRHGFILLEKPEFDFEQLISELKTKWDIEVGDYELEDGSLVFECDDNLLSVALMEAPIPDGEAEYFAEANYMWPEAVETTKKHQAHLVVLTLNRNGNSFEAAAIFSMLVSSCLNQKSVLGIYTSGTVFQPKFYDEVANLMKKGDVPVPIWVYVGLGRTEEGNAGYTYGMDAFGKMEMEILDSSHTLEEIQSFLYYVAEYVIKENMIFRDGETISFTSEEKLKITKSAGVRLEGETLKIWF